MRKRTQRVRELEQALEPTYLEVGWSRPRPLLPWRARLSLWLWASFWVVIVTYFVVSALLNAPANPLELLVGGLRPSHGSRHPEVFGGLLTVWLLTWFTTRRGAVLWTVLAALAYMFFSAFLYGLRGLPPVVGG